MHIFSAIQDDNDIISQCLGEIVGGHFTGLKKKDITPKCLDKIIASLKYFDAQGMNPDGVYCKHLENNIMELRIQLPKSQYLLRVFGGYQQEEMVLLTGYLIKPQEYTDTQTTKSVDKKYEEHIQIAKTYRHDFTTKQAHEYIDITHTLFTHIL